MANGTLIRNTHRHDVLVTSQPPTSGPMTNAIPVHAVQAPIAAPRSSPWNVAAITASPAGVRMAPVAPCRPRATINVVPVGARAHGTHMRPKLTMPIKQAPRPEEIAERASDEEKRAERQEVGVDDPLLKREPLPRSRSIDGKATLTTVESTKTITEPRMHATIMSRLRVSVARCSILAEGGRQAMSDYQITHISDVDDWLGDYPGEMRGITYGIGAEQVALTYRRMPQHTGSKGSYGHRHKTQEEVYFVISGTLLFKLGDEIREVSSITRCGSRRGRFAGSGTTSPRTPS